MAGVVSNNHCRSSTDASVVTTKCPSTKFTASLLLRRFTVFAQLQGLPPASPPLRFRDSSIAAGGAATVSSTTFCALPSWQPLLPLALPPLRLRALTVFFPLFRLQCRHLLLGDQCGRLLRGVLSVPAATAASVPAAISVGVFFVACFRCLPLFPLSPATLESLHVACFA